MSVYLDMLCVEKAISDGLIASSSDVDKYRRGHLEGIQAIRNHYEIRCLKPIRIVEKNHSVLSPRIIALLMTREYDGRLVDSIIKEETLVLSDRINLLREIQALSDKEHVLSDDKLYTLPSYQASSESTIDRSILVPALQVIHSIKKKPRTRQEIANVLPEHILDGHPLDKIIQMLVENRAL